MATTCQPGSRVKAGQPVMKVNRTRREQDITCPRHALLLPRAGGLHLARRTTVEAPVPRKDFLCLDASGWCRSIQAGTTSRVTRSSWRSH